MYNDIGSLIKDLRSKNNISQETLANKTYISRSSLSMIEIGKRQAPDDFLILASNVLEFDFISFKEKYSNFKTIDHFTLTYSMLNCIQMNDIYALSSLLENEIVKKEFDYGEPLGVKNYCKVLLLIRQKKDYISAINICYNFFNIDNSSISSFNPQVNMPHYYYSLIISLGFSLTMIDDKKNSYILHNILVNYFESTYFNRYIPFTSVDNFYCKSYIIALNNLANSYFDLGDFNKALIVCNKGIYTSKQLDILTLLDALLELKTEILYNLSDIEGAKTSFLQFKAICEITYYDEYFEEVSINFKKKYPLLFD